MREAILTNRILGGKFELKPKDMAEVDGVLVEDLDVQEPLVKVVGRDQRDTGRQAVIDLKRPTSSAARREQAKHARWEARGRPETDLDQLFTEPLGGEVAADHGVD